MVIFFMKNTFLRSFIVLFLLMSVSSVSAGLCKYPDGYYHDCTYYYGVYPTPNDYEAYYLGYNRGFDNGYDLGYRAGYDYGYYSGVQGYRQGYHYDYERRAYQTSQEYYLAKWSSIRYIS